MAISTPSIGGESGKLSRTARVRGTPIDEAAIIKALDQAAHPHPDRVNEIVEVALQLKGLSPDEAAVLLQAEPEQLPLVFDAARRVKDAIYGGRIVLFAPIYLTNVCTNNCLYCSFRRDNRSLRRKSLSLDEVAEQVRFLQGMGHKRLLVEAGESVSNQLIDYVTSAIETIYSTKIGNGSIRRVNVNIAATTIENYRRLKAVGIGTYQLFQETYHRETYSTVHPSGPKSDYDYHLTAMDRAMEAGIDDVGIGALFGLYEYRFETLAILQHAKYLERKFGVGPHTISVPRWRPATGTDFVPAHQVSDLDFKRIVAVLRLAVPYTGIILSTRERPDMRDELLSLGVSQISAASSTSPGGYCSEQEGNRSQFATADRRSLDEVVRQICRKGYLPSFCTACYRRGRTGEAFMELAKPGDIQEMCRPNALLTFEEYLLDYASTETRKLGERLIRQQLEGIENPALQRSTRKRLDEIVGGKRDLYF